MRGIPEYNYPLFNRAAAWLRGQGWSVFNPAEHDDGIHPTSPTPSDMRRVLKLDTAAVLDSDAIALLPGWEKSAGATIEFALAKECGLDIYDIHEDWEDDMTMTLWADSLVQRVPKISIQNMLLADGLLTNVKSYMFKTAGN